MGMPRRLTLLVVIGGVGCLLAASAAGAATRAYETPWGGADDVSFTAKLKHGQPVKVVDLTFGGFTFPCSTGPVTFSAAGIQPIKVKDGRFRLDVYGTDPGDPKAVFLGRINESGTRANGSYSVKGTFPGDMQCEGSHAWFAKEV